MSLVQTPYISIINLSRKGLSFIPDGPKELISVAISSVLMLLYTNNFLPDNYRIKAFDGPLNNFLIYFLLFLIIILSTGKDKDKYKYKYKDKDEDVKAVSLNLFLLIPGLVFAIWMLVSYCMHSIGVGFLSYIIAMFVVIPIGIIALNDSDTRGKFLRSLSFGMVIAAAETLCVSLLFSATFTNSAGKLLRYAGITRNANLLAMIMLAGMIGLIYLAVSDSMPHVITWILGVSFIIIMFMTQSRTAMICAFISIVLTLLWRNGVDGMIRTEETGKNRGITLKVMIVLLVVFGIAAIVMIRPLINGNLIVDDVDESSVDFDSVSSGRLHIWEYIFGEFNVFGHEVNYFSDLLPDDMKYAGAHNTALDFAYRCGAPCGAAFLIMELISIAYAVILFKKASPGKYDRCFIIITVITFAVESMFEIQVLPSDRNITMLYFIVCMLIMSKDQGKTDLNPDRSQSKGQSAITD